MKKNVPRFLAWLLLLGGLAGGPVATRLGRSVPPGILRWLVTAGAALMIISFFWFPRRGEGRLPERRTPARRKPPAVKAKQRTGVQRKTTRKAVAPERRRDQMAQRTPVVPDQDVRPVGRRARKQSQAAAAKRSKR